MRITGMVLGCLVALQALLVAKNAASAGATDTTLADQTDIALTAYNNGIGLVRDTREVSLSEGEMQLRFMDVAQQVRPETVGLRSVARPGSIAILEQNYEYDLMTPAKMMEKYVGKDIKLVNLDKRVGLTEVGASLLSVNEGPVYKVGERIYLGHPANVVLPEIPANLVAKPSLIWTVSNTAPDQKLELTYLTNGVTWKADYVLTLAKDEKSLDLTAWVTMNNQSGATYTNAQLKLVAGEVNLAPQVVDGGGGLEVHDLTVQYDKAPEEMPREEAFGEYHLYTVPRRTTIKENQSKQIMLLEAPGVKCAKKYEYRGEESFYSQQMEPTENEHVPVYLEFENKKENQVGLPLPAGVMRIYQEDSGGMLQFTGEDTVKHTPKDEKVTLHMGDAFDLVASRVQKDFNQVASNLTESAYEITLRNHKDTDVVVDVVEPMPGDWRIIEKSQEFTKKDARTAVFSVPVKKDGEAKVTYRVQVKF
ncbi:MAG: DUF4139 domain-containing protein [Candidatus Hydrogenedentes bacterium]|nr:DUF4139 domain-containing protein [Candidatus Hydrogenedentota bacterium]